MVRHGYFSVATVRSCPKESEQSVAVSLTNISGASSGMRTPR